jgi:hypothetical protein
MAEASFESLRHGEQYKPKSKTNRQSATKEKLGASTPRGARRLERMTKQAVATATETISEHLSPRSSPRLSPRKPNRGNFEFPDKLEASGSALAGLEEEGDLDEGGAGLMVEGGIEGFMKISAAKTAAKIWREKTQRKQAEKMALKSNDGGKLLIEAATEKVKAAEDMSVRCQGANKLMQATVDEYDHQLDALQVQIENQFKPAVSRMILYYHLSIPFLLVSNPFFCSYCHLKYMFTPITKTYLFETKIYKGESDGRLKMFR